MRIRGTKPEFWESSRIASVSWQSRLVLKGLESYVDDNGVGKDDAERIVSQVFGRDAIREPSRTFQKVTESISELHRAGLLWRYNVDGEDLLYISFWEQSQRIDKPRPGRFRRPDGTLHYKESEIRESSRGFAKVPEKEAPVTEEQRNRGTGEQGLKDSFNAAVATIEHEVQNEPSNPYPADFLRFYDTYPRHQKKGDALKAFRKAKNRATVQEIIDGAQRLRDDPNREDQYTPLPASWLNADGWEDEPLPARNLPATVTQFTPRRTATDKAHSILSMADEAKRIRGEA